MKSPLSRRDFLKLASALMLAPMVPTSSASNSQKDSAIVSSRISVKQSDLPNVIIIIFDALSALHLPPYGYTRDTSPNLNRFAQQSIVYHNHHSAGNFTTPSTASLLTGV